LDLNRVELAFQAGRLINDEKEIIPKDDSDVAKFLDSEECNILRADQKSIKKLLQEFEHIDTWNTIKSGGKNKFWYKLEEGLSSVYVALECIIESHIFTPLAILGEIDLFTTWVPLVKHARIFHDVSTLRKFIHLKVPLLWPISGRDIVIQGTGTVLRDKKACIICMSSLKGDVSMGIPIPQKDKGDVRMTIHTGTVYMEYINENRTLFRWLFNMDPCLSAIPMTLINWGVKKGAGKLLERIQDRSKNFKGSPFEQRVKEKPELYDLVKKKLDEALYPEEHSKESQQKEEQIVTKKMLV